jgi:plasmid stabilization system protein ParE
MAYRVELAKNAEAELEELYIWVVERAPSQGAAWFNGLERAILSLGQLPKRCRIAPESFDAEQPVRVFSYGRSPHVYRVLSRSKNARALSESSTSGVERGKDAHLVSSKMGSAAAQHVVAATGSSGPMP